MKKRKKKEKRESHLKWFGYVQRRVINATVRDDMGKNGGGGSGNKKSVQKLSFSNGFRNPISLREEITGKKQTKEGNSINSKSMLKLEHLQKLACNVGQWGGHYSFFGYY